MDRGVIATASELFEARHYPSVVAVCADALDDEPECLPLLLIRARAHVALRRDLEAQADLRDIIRLDPTCSLAFRLLGELAARRDENEPAAVFFREALRLDPGDRSAHDWLLIVDAPRPAAVAHQSPAPTAAAGHFFPSASPARLPARARGTQPIEPVVDERPTRPFARGSDRDGSAWAPRVRATATPQPPAPLTPPAPIEVPTLKGRPEPLLPAKPAPAATPRPTSRSATPELPGFGEYLVTSGILSRERLRAAQAYQRSMKVQLSTAVVTLGLASPQRIAWAAVAHQSQLARERT